jgi:hypothetical protein
MAYIGNEPTSAAFVTDSFSGNASTLAFTMSVAPANPSSALVAISGILQDPTTYSVSGTTLTFSSAPPVGTGNISVRYLGIPASGVTTTAYRTVTEFTATAGQTTFSPPSYTVGFITVYRNGVRLGTADFTATNGTSVVLVNAATVGDLVTTEAMLVSSVVNAVPSTGGTVAGNMVVSGTLDVNSNALNVGATGNVGIGTASPTNKLDIIGGSNILGLTNTSASGYEAINMVVGTQAARIVLTGQSFADANYGTGDLTIQAQTAGKGIRFGTNGGTNQMILDSSGVLSFNSGYGSAAKAYGCRAWCYYNATPAIVASGNVSSLTIVATGDVRLNFTTNMVDANYAVSATTNEESGGPKWCNATQSAVDNIRVVTFNPSQTKVANGYNWVAVFR